MKPDYKERFTSSGDTIPPSRVSGPGGGGHKAYYDTGTASGEGGSYPTGTKMIGWKENAHPSVVNRPIWYLANNVDYLFEKEIARIAYKAYYGANSNIVFHYPSILFLGKEGEAEDTLWKYVGLYDTNFRPFKEQNTRVQVTGIYLNSGLTVPAYPQGGLLPIGPRNGSGNIIPAKIQSVALDTIILYSPGIGNSWAVDRVSLFNYSLWLRLLRDEGPDSPNLHKAFASIVQKLLDTKFIMHKDVESLGWSSANGGDEIYTTWFASNVYLKFSGTIPNNTPYYVVFAQHSCFGTSTPESGVGIELAKDKEYPSLDDAYDGGRVVKLDNGSIDIDTSSSIVGEEAVRVHTGFFIGNAGFSVCDNFGYSNMPSSYGFMFRKLCGFSGNTNISIEGEECTGDNTGLVTLTTSGSKFHTGGNTELYLQHDLGLILKQDGSPLGLYVLNSLGAGNNQAYFYGLDGFVKDLSGAKTIFIYRPLAALPGQAGACTFSPFESPTLRARAARFLCIPGRDESYWFTCEDNKEGYILLSAQPAADLTPRVYFNKEGYKIFNLGCYQDATSDEAIIAFSLDSEMRLRKYGNTFKSIISPFDKNTGIYKNGTWKTTTLILGGVDTNDQIAPNSGWFRCGHDGYGIYVSLGVMNESQQGIGISVRDNPSETPPYRDKKIDISDNAILGYDSYFTTGYRTINNSKALASSGWVYEFNGDYWSTTTVDAELIFPIELPDQVIITGMALFWCGNATATLLKREFNSNAPINTGVSLTVNNGSAGYSEITTDNLLVNHRYTSLVNGQTYHIKIHVNNSSPTTVIHGVKVLFKYKYILL